MDTLTTVDLARDAEAAIAAARVRLFAALEKDVADFVRGRLPAATAVDVFDKTTARQGDVRRVVVHVSNCAVPVTYEWDHGVDDALWTLQRFTMRLRSHGWQQPRPGDYSSPYRVVFAAADATFDQLAR